VVETRPSFAWSRQEIGRTTPAAGECLLVAARREAVDAGIAVLQEGGNAIDAAVCMAFVAAVVEPTEASVGGSGFMLVHDGRSAWSIEFPPRAPLAARPGMFDPIGDSPDQRLLGTVRVRGDANATGPLAPCVPGVVAGLSLATRRFGTRPLARLIAPAIELAEAGFEVDDYFTLQALAHLRDLRAAPEAGRVFLRGGLPPVAPFAAATEPPKIRQPDLARTLRAVAADGPDTFYRGPVADSLVRAFEERGGLICHADLRGYRAIVGAPLARRYRGWCVFSPRAPCGGWTALQALGILDHLPLAELAAGSAGRFHLIAEALRLAFADRYRLGGDRGLEPGVPARLLSESRARAGARSIRHDRVSGRVLAATPSAADVGHGTTHLAVVDAGGRMVSCTITAGNTFGSKFMAPGTGVLFDSGMAWFDPRTGSVNSIAPSKRPLVNMAPLLLLNEGRARLAVGAAGGRRIISAVTQVVSAVVDHRLGAQEAVSAPRLDASDGYIRLSDRVPDAVASELSAMGHQVIAVAEQHAPFSYELARPVAVAVDEAGIRSGGIHPFSRGFVAGR